MSAGTDIVYISTTRPTPHPPVTRTRAHAQGPVPVSPCGVPRGFGGSRGEVIFFRSNVKIFCVFGARGSDGTLVSLMNGLFTFKLRERAFVRARARAPRRDVAIDGAPRVAHQGHAASLLFICFSYYLLLFVIIVSYLRVRWKLIRVDCLLL